jgi:ABC-type transporter Mla subunit MlaD
MTSPQTKELEEGFLSATRKSQELVLEALKTWVDTVQAFTPKVPSVQLPFADRLPKADDVVANTYDFIAQILASQRKFAEEVVKTTSPLLPGEKKASAAK